VIAGAIASNCDTLQHGLANQVIAAAVQCVALCWVVAVCGSVWQCVAVRGSVLQGVLLELSQSCNCISFAISFLPPCLYTCVWDRFVECCMPCCRWCCRRCCRRILHP